MKNQNITVLPKNMKTIYTFKQFLNYLKIINVKFLSLRMRYRYYKCNYISSLSASFAGYFVLQSSRTCIFETRVSLQTIYFQLVFSKITVICVKHQGLGTIYTYINFMSVRNYILTVIQYFIQLSVSFKLNTYGVQ